MKRYISKRDDKCYTNMLKIINTIGGRNLDYNWLITEIETNTGDYFYDQYIILSNNELLDKLESNEIQWIWGNFSGIPTKYSKKEILTSKLPGLDNIDKKIITIQHPLAEIEIIAYDSTFVQIITKDDIDLNNSDLIKNVIKKIIEFTNKYENEEILELVNNKWL